ncbi:hypothetical protein PI126_g7594 [Phytophthora idaei]|nr:hypothetical protein PI126_g7594 [Phytophthora idaei]
MVLTTRGIVAVTAAGRGDGGSSRPTASSPSMAGSRRGCGRGVATVSSAVSGTPQGTVATTREQTPDSSRRDPAARTPPMMLQEVHLNKLVAFTPEREAWMKSKHYRPIGPTYIVGRVCRRPMRGKFVSLFEIRWLDSQFQDVVEHVSVGCDQSGVKTYKALTRLKDNPDWQELVTGDDDDDIDVDDHDDLQAADDYAEFDPASTSLVTRISRDQVTDELAVVTTMLLVGSATAGQAGASAGVDAGSDVLAMAAKMLLSVDAYADEVSKLSLVAWISWLRWPSWWCLRELWRRLDEVSELLLLM